MPQFFKVSQGRQAEVGVICQQFRKVRMVATEGAESGVLRVVTPSDHACCHALASAMLNAATSRKPTADRLFSAGKISSSLSRRFLRDNSAESSSTAGLTFAGDKSDRLLEPQKNLSPI